MVLEEKNHILQGTGIPGTGAVPREGGPVVKAVEAEMRLAGPFEKAPADRAEGLSRRPQLFQAAPADDPLARPLEEGMAELARRGKEENLGKFAPGSKTPAQGGRQAPASSSFFCWQSMQ
jgi:hypothetical protein